MAVKGSNDGDLPDLTGSHSDGRLSEGKRQWGWGITMAYTSSPGHPRSAAISVIWRDWGAGLHSFTLATSPPDPITHTHKLIITNKGADYFITTSVLTSCHTPNTHMHTFTQTCTTRERPKKKKRFSNFGRWLQKSLPEVNWCYQNPSLTLNWIWRHSRAKILHVDLGATTPDIRLGYMSQNCWNMVHALWSMTFHEYCSQLLRDNVPKFNIFDLGINATSRSVLEGLQSVSTLSEKGFCVLTHSKHGFF